MRIESRIKHAALALSSAALLASLNGSAAQDAPRELARAAQVNLSDPNYGTLHWKTRLGSFRLIDGIGRVEVQFTGSILINQLDGTLAVSGDLRKEYEGHAREVYFGTGSIVAQGAFRAIQWFGRDMSATWRGFGTARIFGEFDEKLETGEYWYGDDTRRVAWSPFGQTIWNPEKKYIGTGVPEPVRQPKKP